MIQIDGVYQNSLNISSDYFNGTILIKFQLELPLNLQTIYLLIFYISYNSLPICAISDTNITQQDIKFSSYSNFVNSKNHNSLNIYFDRQAAVTMQPFHMVQMHIKDKSIVHILISDFFQKISQFKATYTVYITEDKVECINNCNSIHINAEMILNKCNKGICECGSRYFGSYCQLRKTTLNTDTPYDVYVAPKDWRYFSLDIDSLEDQDDTYMVVDKLNYDITISFGYDGLVAYSVPSLHHSGFIISSNKDKENSDTYSLSGQIYYYRELIKNNPQKQQQILYLGFLNSNQFSLTFQIQVISGRMGKLKNFIKKNFILIIILATNIAIAFTFLCISAFVKQRQEQLQEDTDRQVQVRRIRRIRRKRQVGFNQDFIEQHFKPNKYEEVVSFYPALTEMSECIICMESMTEEDSNICCVTPCFHMLHHHCLATWLLRSRNCPVCREQFDETKIESKQWLNLTDNQTPSASNRNNQSMYIKRMKRKLKKRDLSEDEEQKQFNNSILDNSSQDLVYQHNNSVIDDSTIIEQEQEQEIQNQAPPIEIESKKPEQLQSVPKENEDEQPQESIRQ